MKPKANPSDVRVRDFSESDIPFVLDYWYRSPPDFVASRGVDLAKLPPEHEMEASLLKKVEENKGQALSQLSAVTIIYQERPTGFHSLNPLKIGDFGIFHAHIWDASLRGMGIGLQSYPQACQVFAERFDLKRILFKTPVQNVSAIRVKEKLGIRLIGEETIGFGIIKEGTLAKVYELTREELNLRGQRK